MSAQVVPAVPVPAEHPPALTALLKRRTTALHRAAERAGVMQPLLRGTLGRTAYCRLLRNLHAIYGVLERGLLRHRADPAIAPVCLPELFRTDAIAADLARLHGDGWQAALPLAPAAADYAARLATIADEAPALLLAHAYVRFLGDLSGGQALRRVVAGNPALDPLAIRLYEFGAADEVARLAARLRAGIDALAATRGRLVDGGPSDDAIVREAQSAFERHVALFEQLATAG